MELASNEFVLEFRSDRTKIISKDVTSFHLHVHVTSVLLPCFYLQSSSANHLINELCSLQWLFNFTPPFFNYLPHVTTDFSRSYFTSHVVGLTDLPCGYRCNQQLQKNAGHLFNKRCLSGVLKACNDLRIIIISFF